MHIEDIKLFIKTDFILQIWAAGKLAPKILWNKQLAL